MHLALAVREAMGGGADSLYALPMAFAVGMAWLHSIRVPPARAHALAFSRVPSTLNDRLAAVPFPCGVARCGGHIAGMVFLQMLLLQVQWCHSFRRRLLDAA